MFTTYTSINHVLKSLKRSFYLLFVILIAIAGFFVFIVNKSYQDLNDYSKNASINVYQAVMKREQENLRRLVFDYSYWTTAAEGISGEIDYEFVDDSYDGAYLEETFSIDALAVFDLDGGLMITVTDGNRTEQVDQRFVTPMFDSLFKQALDTDYASPSTISSFIDFDGQAHFVAASAITPSVLTEAFPEPAAYGVLVMTQPIDQTLLSEWARDYNLLDIKIQSLDQATPEKYLSSVLKNSQGEAIYKLIWLPDLPGQVFIHEVLPIAIVIITLLLVMSIIYGSQLDSYIRFTLKAANELEESRDELHKLAHYDSITHLPNRLLGMDRLKQALNGSMRNQTLTAVLFIDLDKFKPINDTYGHDVGDKLLRAIGELIDSCIRSGVDTVSRLGGDEFIVVLANLKDKQDAIIVADKVVNLLAEDIKLADLTLNVTASVGITVTSSSTVSADDLIKQADNAMYKAKQLGKNRYYLAE